MTSPLPQGNPTIGRMCALAGVSRAGYYRHFEASAPRQEETGVRDAIQRWRSQSRGLAFMHTRVAPMHLRPAIRH